MAVRRHGYIMAHNLTIHSGEIKVKHFLKANSFREFPVVADLHLVPVDADNYSVPPYTNIPNPQEVIHFDPGYSHPFAEHQEVHTLR